MGNQRLKITHISQVTQQLLQIITEKPAGFNFLPGQSAHLAINESFGPTENALAPMALDPSSGTCSLTFFIKTGPEHADIIAELLALKQGHALVCEQTLGGLAEPGEGVFIAAGTTTPILSILQSLRPQQRATNQRPLLFTNKATLIF